MIPENQLSVECIFRSLTDLMQGLKIKIFRWLVTGPNVLYCEF